MIETSLCDHKSTIVRRLLIVNSQVTREHFVEMSQIRQQHISLQS